MSQSNRGEPAQARPRGGEAPSQRSGLRRGVSKAIAEAALGELADSGYAGLSMEGVARRAGVGKAALYRRWRSKREMVGEVISTRVDATLLRVPDTGSLLGDLESLLEELGQELWQPQVAAIAPDLLAASRRDPELAGTLATVVMAPRRQAATGVLDAAIARGELPESLDTQLAIDLIVGAPAFRAFVTGAQRASGYTQRLAGALTAALPQLG